MALEMNCRDVYMRHTGTDGKPYVQSHRVWDAERFIASQQRAVDDVNAKEKDPAKRVARVEQITEDQYRKDRTK